MTGPGAASVQDAIRGVLEAWETLQHHDGSNRESYWASRDRVAAAIGALAEWQHGPCCDPVGAVEIAERLGVARVTVDQWRQRDIGFPAPSWPVGGRPAWNWPVVKAWHNNRGR